MRIKLLNDGGFLGFRGVDFPIEVDAVFTPADALKGTAAYYKVSYKELKRIGYTGVSRAEKPEGLNWLTHEAETIE